MRKSNTAKDAGTVVRQILASLLALILLAGSLPVLGADAAEPSYIVKYKASSIHQPDDGMPFDLVSREEMERLRDADELEWYEENGTAALIDPELPLRQGASLFSYSRFDQWNLKMIGAETAYQMNFLGQGVRVGVIDSGVYAHPDLAANLVAGHNYTTGAADPNNTTDNYGHGTKVAGLIAASSKSGYMGVAPGVEIVPLKVTDEKNNISIYDICRAIVGGIDDYHCDVLNLSLGTETNYTPLREAIAYAAEQGVVVVAAAGNKDYLTDSALRYPAAYDTVIGVGAVDSSGEIFSGSVCNSSVFLTAPGMYVRSTSCLGGYDDYSTGTSFSAPQVAGAAAVLLGADPSLTPENIMDLLAETAADKEPEGWDEQYGYGILSVSGCMTALAARAAGSDPCVFCPFTGPAHCLYNNTNADLECVYLLAEYEETGRLGTVTAQDLTVPAHGIAEIKIPDGERYGQFVCQPGTMVPLIAARKAS